MKRGTKVKSPRAKWPAKVRAATGSRHFAKTEMSHHTYKGPKGGRKKR